MFSIFFSMAANWTLLTDALKFDEVESLHEKESDFSS